MNKSNSSLKMMSENTVSKYIKLLKFYHSMFINSTGLFHFVQFFCFNLSDFYAILPALPIFRACSPQKRCYNVTVVCNVLTVEVRNSPLCCRRQSGGKAIPMKTPAMKNIDAAGFCVTALTIGGLRFRLLLPEQPRIGQEILPFVEEADTPADVTVTCLPDETAAGKEVTVSSEGDCVTVRYRPDLAWHFGTLRGCLISIPMERILLAHGRFFLHASFVASPWGGLLFAGVSGAGKSTQAELWQKHADSIVINGDRAIVGRQTDGWRAWGSPYSGSSGYYVKRDEPIRAIVLPEKAGENRIEILPAPESFRKLLLQISMDFSSAEDVRRLSDLTTELIASVPVYRLFCTPDVRAVITLQKKLEDPQHSPGFRF